MIWSYSASRMFQRCQRQWYFKTCVAHHSAKDPIRREAYLLSKLQSIAAWRGSIVDSVISRRVVPAINNGWGINEAKLIDFAREIFDSQLSFASRHRIYEPNMKPSKAGDSFAAFHAVEYQKLCEADVAQAWKDIIQALGNLLQMRELFDLLQSANYLIAQRPLVFPSHKGSVRAVPDLIAFFKNQPPLIIDWKVHTYGTRDYRTQLAIYAIALFECSPHRDFPIFFSKSKPTDSKLFEVQLLTNVRREYTLSKQDIQQTKSYIAASMERMLLAKGIQKNSVLRPFDFEVTLYPDNCTRCPFRKICWEDSLWQS